MLPPPPSRVAIPLALVAGAAVITTLARPLLAPLETWSIDARVAMRPTPKAARVVAVPLDAAALARPLEGLGTDAPPDGPWELVPRIQIELQNAGATAVAFDFPTLQESVAIPDDVIGKTQQEITERLQLDAIVEHGNVVRDAHAIEEQPASTDVIAMMLSSFTVSSGVTLTMASVPLVAPFAANDAPPTRSGRSEREFLSRTALPADPFGLSTLPSVSSVTVPVERDAHGYGVVDLVPDRDGVIRRTAPLVRYAEGVLPSLAFSAAAFHLEIDASRLRVENGRLRLRRDTSVPLDRAGRFLIPWTDDERLATVSVSELFAASPETRETLDGSVAVVYLESRPRVATPLGSMPPGRVHAHVARALVAGDGVTAALPIYGAGWLGALAISLYVAGTLLSASRLVPATLVLVLVHGVAAFGFASTGVLVPFAAPLAFVMLAGIALVWNATRLADAEKRRLDSLLANLRGATDDADLRGRLERLELEVERRPIKLGPYRLTGLIERGGMGAVFRAIDESLQRPVAVKIVAEIEGEMRARFQREAELVARISHPNVVQVFGVGEHAGVPYFAMELVEGESLARRLVSGGPMEPVAALRLAAQIARGLQAAHEHGIVHRDVKPSNVLLANGTAKLVDFGVAKAGETGLTGTGAILGTADYMSPEQAQGLPLDHRSDLYSLGVTLFRMLAGALPFSGESAIGVIYKHVNLPAPDLRDARPDLPTEIAVLLAQILEKQAQKRPASAAILIERFESLANELEAKAKKRA